jgi:DHA1 family bicyclomycin/chloramphenicol resistance-like MFS transporter
MTPGAVPALIAGPGRWGRIGTPQILFLGIVTAVLPLTVDLYLPAMPQMGEDLDVSVPVIQLSLTVTLVGVAVGQLVFGPLSDRLGRRPPLIGAFACFVVASVACALSTTLVALLVSRGLQGFFASAGIAVTLAVVRDHMTGAALGRAVAGLMLVRAAGPILAPLLGGLILLVTGWQGTFVTLAAFGVLVLIGLCIGLPESLPRSERVVPSASGLARLYLRLVSDRSFIAPALATAFSFSAIFAWLGGAAFVLGDGYGLSPTAVGIFFGLASVLTTVGAQVGARLMPRLGGLGVLRAAPVVGAAAAVALVVLAATDHLPLGLLLPLVMAVTFSVGATLPVGATMALTGQPPSRAGLASGLLGVLQFVIGGLAAPAVGVLGSGSMSGLASVMLAGFVLAFVMARVSREAR